MEAQTVPEAFEYVAAKHPDALALVSEHHQLTYRQLNEQANLIAHNLQKKGVIPGDGVAFSMPRDPRSIALMLGILKAGAIMIPIDGTYPQKRIDFILDDSFAKLYVVDEYFSELQEYVFGGEKNLDVHALPDEGCYCLYTSGSTGTPKGVLVPHRGILNLAKSLEIYEDLSDISRIGFSTTFTFDVAMQEIFTTLLNGFTGVILPERRMTSTSQMVDSIIALKVDMLFATPTYFGALTHSADEAQRLLKQLKLVCLAGEKFFLNAHVQKLRSEGSVSTRFDNQYGPVELSVIAAARHVKDDTYASIGKPVPHMKVYVVKEDKTLAAPGEKGELYFAGRGVALGYLNRPDLTAERFLKNNFENFDGAELGKEYETLYTTGDVGYLSEEGEIIYVGRNDFQVKVRGQRIELEEIESALLQCREVENVAVVVQTNEANRQFICAFYTCTSSNEQDKPPRNKSEQGRPPRNNSEQGRPPRPSKTATERAAKTLSTSSEESTTDRYRSLSQKDSATATFEEQLKKHIQNTLPVYMVPDLFIAMDALPQLPNGKINKQALPDVTNKAHQANQKEVYVAPQTPLEKRIIGAMEAVLPQEKIGMTDDFFALGGDSLNVIEFVAQMRSAGLDIAIQDVFNNPTAQALTTYVQGRTEAQTELGFDGAFLQEIESLMKTNLLHVADPLGDNSLEKTGRAPRGILLTGATGFLGAHVLHELLEKTKAHIYCLVRAQTSEEASARLKAKYTYYFPHDSVHLDASATTSDFEKRVSAVVGDLEKSDLGLTKTFAQKLKKESDLIINCAANVNYYGKYEDFYQTNVSSVKNLLTFLRDALFLRTGIRLLHVSTISVAGSGFLEGATRDREPYHEASFYQNQTFSTSYARSKFEAEAEILKARAEGLPVTILRMGNLLNRKADGHFQENYESNSFVRHLRALAHLGRVPRSFLEEQFEISPIDEAAGAIVAIALHPPQKAFVLHLTNPHTIFGKDLLDALEAHGYQFELVESDQYEQEILSLSHACPKSKKEEEAAQLFLSDYATLGRIAFDPDNPASSKRTALYLARQGFSWTPPDIPYLKNLIAFFIDKGFISL